MNHLRRIKQGLLTALIVTVALNVTGCGVLGVPQADTFNKRVVQANGLVEVTANMVPVAYEAGKIDREEARTTLDNLRITAAGIDNAVLIRSTKPAEADVILTSTITALTVLKAALEAKGK